MRAGGGGAGLRGGRYTQLETALAGWQLSRSQPRRTDQATLAS